MTDEAKKEDVKEQEAVTPVEANQEETQKPSEEAVGSKEYNWRQMEEKNKQLARELEELRVVVKENKPVEKQEEVDELAELQEDDLITVRQVNKLAEKKARKIIEEELAKKEKAKLPEQTKAKFSDYEQVVTNDNIQELIKEDPDLEYDIQVAKNPFARAYKAIKQSKFYQQRMQNRESEERMEENAKKPISSNTIGKQRPLSHANAYAKGSPDLLSEMQKFRGGSL